MFQAPEHGGMEGRGKDMCVWGWGQRRGAGGVWFRILPLPPTGPLPPGALDLNQLSVSQTHTLLPTLGLSNLLEQRAQITPVLSLYPRL